MVVKCKTCGAALTANTLDGCPNCRPNNRRVRPLLWMAAILTDPLYWIVGVLIFIWLLRMAWD